MKIILIGYLIYFTWLFCGCRTSKDLQYGSSSYVCNTTIKGRLASPEVYKYFAPAILYKDDQKINIRLGNVVYQNDEGIYFVDKKRSILHNPDTVFINKTLIRAVIDSNQFCTYGKLKVDEYKNLSLKLYISRVNDTDTIPKYLEIFSDQEFSFCIDPGIYKVKKIIREEMPDGCYYESFPEIDFTFEVAENKVNYLGDFFLLSKDKASQNTVRIPYFKQLLENPAASKSGLLEWTVHKVSNYLAKDNLHGYFYIEIKNPGCSVNIKSRY